MDIHKNAKLTPQSRADVVRRVLDEGQTPAAVATAVGVCARTVRKWVARYQAEGAAGLVDRSSRPRCSPHAVPGATVSRIIALRRLRWTGAQIAAAVGVAPATVSRVLRRQGLARLEALDPAPPVRRYEHPHPGDMLHLDIKKLGRFRRAGHRVTRDRSSSSPGVGWEYVHVCVDDHSRVAFSQLYPDQRGDSGNGFPLRRRRLLPPPRHHRPDDCSPTTAAATAPGPSTHAAANSASAIAIPGPSHPEPTARQSDSSKPR